MSVATPVVRRPRAVLSVEAAAGAGYESWMWLFPLL